MAKKKLTEEQENEIKVLLENNLPFYNILFIILLSSLNFDFKFLIPFIIKI
jgi:hypothetical protein